MRQIKCMLFSPHCWLTPNLLVTNALMKMQWLSLGRGQDSSTMWSLH